jgi:hypothetical protein
VPRYADLLALLWILAAAIVIFIPALRHNVAVGSYDVLSQFGLTHRAGATVHNIWLSDTSFELIPWTSMSWMQVHAGHLPLWNPYSALGTPLAFNWQSASFSLPALVGYAFPLSWAYTVQLVGTLVIAGSGMYFFARVAGCRAASAVFAATVFELSGAMMLYVGWPIAGVMAWLGWMLACITLIVQGRSRRGAIVLLALSCAFAVYAGQPDALLILGTAVGVFTLTMLIRSRFGPGRESFALGPALVALAAGGALGLALSAPLLLPGVQVLSGSIRNLGGGGIWAHTALPFQSLGDLATAGLDGNLPFPESGYLGAIPVMLALTGLSVRWREREMLSLFSMGIVAAIFAYLQPVSSALASTPGMQSVRWSRAVIVLVGSLAALSGLGLDLLRGSRDRQRAVDRRFAVAFGLVVLFGLGLAVTGRLHHWTWVVIGGVLPLAAILVCRRIPSSSPVQGRVRVGVAIGLLVGACAYLYPIGSTIWPAEGQVTKTAAANQLRHLTGSAIVGFATDDCFNVPTLGIHQEYNAVVGVQELAAYDPMLSRTYFTSWTKLTGHPATDAGTPTASTFCPPISTATLAREYGVGFILTRHGSQPPAGTSFVQQVADEDLYRVPDSSKATLMVAGAAPGTASQPVAVPLSQPSPSRWVAQTSASGPGRITFHLTNSPGWHATVDGKPLALEPYHQVMLQAEVPAGRHTIELDYWPRAFTAGLVCAAIGVLVIAGILAYPVLRRRLGRPAHDR